MTNEAQILETLRDLQRTIGEQNALFSSLREQNSSVSQAIHHFIDFLVILAADVSAAVIVVFTLERRRERDQRNLERSQIVLNKLGPPLPDLIKWLDEYSEIMKRAQATTYALPWGSSRGQLYELLADPELNRESFNWVYPGGSDLKNTFHQMLEQMRALGNTTSGTNFQKIAEILALAKKLNTLRLEQLADRHDL